MGMARQGMAMLMPHQHGHRLRTLTRNLPAIPLMCLAFTCLHVRALRTAGMTGLLAVLTSSTFLYTSELFNSPVGIWAMTHTAARTISIPNKSNIGNDAYTFYRGQAVMFTGLLLVDLFNAGLLLTISMVDEASSSSTETEAKKSDNAV